MTALPMFLEAGINLFACLECAAGVDAVALRKEYGREVLLMGNIAREALMAEWSIAQDGREPQMNAALTPRPSPRGRGARG